MSNYIYNFPISMLRGFMVNSDKSLNDILDFCIWQIYDKHNDLDIVEKTLGITIGNAQRTLKNGRELHKKYRNDGYPWTGISHDVYWAFLRKDRTDFDKATLLAFLAIKSLVGEKPFYKVTNQAVIYKRMAGFKEKEEEAIPREIACYTPRTRFDNIKLELKEHWNVSIYANHVRGMYLSTVLSIDQLALHAERNKLRTRRQIQTNSAMEAREKALMYLSTECPLVQKSSQTPPSEYQKLYDPEMIPF